MDIFLAAEGYGKRLEEGGYGGKDRCSGLIGLTNTLQVTWSVRSVVFDTPARIDAELYLRVIRVSSHVDYCLVLGYGRVQY